MQKSTTNATGTGQSNATIKLQKKREGRKGQKWLVLAFAISLAANLLIGGFLIGQHTARPAVGGPGADPLRTFPRWAGTLDSERLQTLRPLLREHFRGMRPNVRTLRQHQQELREALRAQPYDADAVEQLLDSMSTIQAGMSRHGRETFLAFVAQLSPAERLALSQHLERPHARISRDRGRRDIGPPRLSPRPNPESE